MSREVDRVATRKSLVFILRMNPDGLLCTSCVQYVRRAKLSSIFFSRAELARPLSRFFGSWWDIPGRECRQIRSLAENARPRRSLQNETARAVLGCNSADSKQNRFTASAPRAAASLRSVGHPEGGLAEKN